MTLLVEYIEQGWHETETGSFGKWVAEKFHAQPGASSTVLRVEAESSKSLNAAVGLRQSQLGEAADGPVADVTLPGGVRVTTAEHAGGAIAGTLPVNGPVPTVVIEGYEGVPNEEPEVEATPAAEKLADEAGVDLTQVEGTGKDGKVTKPDVEAAI